MENDYALQAREHRKRLNELNEWEWSERKKLTLEEKVRQIRELFELAYCAGMGRKPLSTEERVRAREVRDRRHAQLLDH